MGWGGLEGTLQCGVRIARFQEVHGAPLVAGRTQHVGVLQPVTPCVIAWGMPEGEGQRGRAAPLPGCTCHLCIHCGCSDRRSFCLLRRAVLPLNAALTALMLAAAASQPALGVCIRSRPLLPPPPLHEALWNDSCPCNGVLRKRTTVFAQHAPRLLPCAVA